jgi:hypothetical protein
MLLRRILSRAFSAEKKLEIVIKKDSDLMKLAKGTKGHKQARWEQKMRAEWLACGIVAAVLLNTVYNSFPDIWLSHNLFTYDRESLVMEAKHEVEA